MLASFHVWSVTIR